eukprot:SAG11_NODE_972_length_6340_cov_3.043423_2_plen_345_part_00
MLDYESGETLGSLALGLRALRPVVEQAHCVRWGPLRKAENSDVASKASESISMAYSSAASSSAASRLRSATTAIGRAHLIFDALDVAGSGVLEPDQVAKALRSLGHSGSATSGPWSNEAIAAALTQMDEDGNGLIDVDEFSTWWVQNGSEDSASHPPKSTGSILSKRLAITGILGGARKRAAQAIADAEREACADQIWGDEAVLRALFLERSRDATGYLALPAAKDLISQMWVITGCEGCGDEVASTLAPMGTVRIDGSWTIGADGIWNWWMEHGRAVPTLAPSLTPATISVVGVAQSQLRPTISLFQRIKRKFVSQQAAKIGAMATRGATAKSISGAQLTHSP